MDNLHNIKLISICKTNQLMIIYGDLKRNQSIKITTQQNNEHLTKRYSEYQEIANNLHDDEIIFDIVFENGRVYERYSKLTGYPFLVKEKMFYIYDISDINRLLSLFVTCPYLCRQLDCERHIQIQQRWEKIDGCYEENIFIDLFYNSDEGSKKVLLKKFDASSRETLLCAIVFFISQIDEI